MKKLLSLILLLSFTIKAQDVKIGTQTWKQRNLDVSTYRNGDNIPQVEDKEEWANLTTGAWCYYENNKDISSLGLGIGKLYNWYAVNDPRGVAPKGYHIPSDAEWTILTDYLGGQELAGAKMKSSGGWNSYSSGRGNYNVTCPNCANWSSIYRTKNSCHRCKDNQVIPAYEPINYSGNGSNSSGFYGGPHGCRSPLGVFADWGNVGNWWSSSESYECCAWCRYLFGEKHLTALMFSVMPSFGKRNGFSVRCIKN